MADTAQSGPVSEPTTFNLLFVCTGNTCRSPMAEAIARRMIDERGWSHVAVRSAGIAADAGAPASEYALWVARAHGLDLDGHEARPLTGALVDWADLILAMGPSHLAALSEHGAELKSALVTEFEEGDGWNQPIADPFGGDRATYHAAFSQLERAIASLLARLEAILAP